jgi:23S rRNA pseudouridine2605 synthase
MMKTLRLQKIIAQAGIASRRKAESLIAQRKVKVNGKIISQQGVLVDPDKDIIEVNGKVVPSIKKDKNYLLLNKPAGYVTTVSDPHHMKTVMDLVPRVKGLFPVGRLDKNTTGLLLLTNDGELAYRLMHPKFNIYKTYHVVTAEKLDKTKINKLSNGVYFDGKKSAKCKVSIIKQDFKNTVVEIIIHEGRKRQIRRMFEVVDHRIFKLERTEYAGIKNDIKQGTCRELKKSEIDMLYNKVKLKRKT